MKSMSAKKVVVVESPAKAKTITKILDYQYQVVASFGHVRDLPKNKMGIDIENHFEPEYIIPKDKSKKVRELKAALKDAEEVVLATDLDREGEAIAWHIAELIPKKTRDKIKIKRITFAEITSTAIKNAMQNPRQIDMDLVYAQQARRVLDKLVGYSLSPVLWRKVGTGLSAGRVQSVALKIIVDREKEIIAHKPEEYWTIEAELDHQLIKGLKAKLTDPDQKYLSNGEQANQSKQELLESQYSIKENKISETTKKPLPPYKTSTLQQDASRLLGLSSKQTMMLAQRLYEAGHITYMRTDSTSISQDAVRAIEQYLDQQGLRFDKKRGQFKTKTKGAQEAHEAIRASDVNRIPESLDGFDAKAVKLYDLIRNRAIASRMEPSRYQKFKLLIEAKAKLGNTYQLVSEARIRTYPGFEAIFEVDKGKFLDLSAVQIKDSLELKNLEMEQKFTKPPARYSEATLIKELESLGVGRPSTYASIISTLLLRYAQKEEGRLKPNLLAFPVTELLTDNFDFVVDPSFTANMESELDQVADGKRIWYQVVEMTYDPMHKTLNEKLEDIPRYQAPKQELDEQCPECKSQLLMRESRYGQFIACSNFPECKYKRSVKTAVAKCPDCEQGEVVEKRTKRGKVFYSCERYPDCKYAVWKKQDIPEQNLIKNS
ncbi:type I DNA topoisomerase [Candidatus Saccharibacteria bacterium]|nr:type I DNA topoisomerase [Candidatus Saccharibacteria bacterium]